MFDRILKFVDRCGILEVIDFGKDLFYVVSKPHKTLGITILLWIATLISVFLTAIPIMFMSTQEFVDLYGLKDFNIESVDQVTYFNLIKAKSLRIVK